jgi:hypothetical protein
LSRTSKIRHVESRSAGQAEGVSRWVASSRFLLIWLFPALLGVYMKWHAMADFGGSAKVLHYLGFGRLTVGDWLGFFRSEILVGFLIVPLALLIINRFVSLRWAAILTGLLSAGLLVLLVIQLRALHEVGRYISIQMMWLALGWGLHEPGANAGYLSATGILATLLALFGMGIVIAWALKAGRRGISNRAQFAVRIAAEVYLLCIVVILAAGWRAGVSATPYHEGTIVRAVASLWNENAVETGEFAAFDFGRTKEPPPNNLPPMSDAEIVKHFRELTQTPVPVEDPRYFGKESGDNLLFFVLETTPEEFLPAYDDMKQFPNLGRLRAKSFVADRHYTTLPVTGCALFSVFSSWYPIDSLRGAWGFTSGDEAPDLLPRLNADGYETGAFTPLRYMAETDQAMYRAVGFRDEYVPSSGLASYDPSAGWKAARVSADVATLHLLESKVDQWTSSGRRFAVAFLPQIGHFPYADSYPPGSTENLRERGRAIIALEDSWLGELMDLLQKRGQLDKTIIVVLGDHGRRNARENPNLRRGTIDETAFHVPLYIYAPHALNHAENIPSLTSHIDITPTVLDLLGVRDRRDSEQGVALWNPGLADRTTFLLAEPTFGADGYASRGKFYMWNYFSDSVFANSEALFDMTDFLPPQSPLSRHVTSQITQLVTLEKAWHVHFGQVPSAERRPGSAPTGQ